MLAYLHQLFLSIPLLALFITISLGYLLGKFRIKKFVVGGIAGTLIVGVIVGQIGIIIPDGIGAIFFALFIYAVGYQGGPQFFKSLNKQTLVQLTSATITCILGLLCVLLAAWFFHLDRGTAAGLAAGGLTQSAIIGTANDAITKLAITPELKQVLQSNVAVGYAVCYIFGSLGPIVLLSAIFPMVMGWDLRKEALKLASLSDLKNPKLEVGQFNALHLFDTRIFQVQANSATVGKQIQNIFENDAEIGIEKIIRNNKEIQLKSKLIIDVDDILVITAKVELLTKLADSLGTEIVKPSSLTMIEEIRKVVLTNKQFANKTIKEWHESISSTIISGVFITSVFRMGERLTPSSDLVLHRGDEIELFGSSNVLDSICPAFSKPLTTANITDFVFFGLGMAIGILIGMLSFHVFDVAVTLGSGVGCLFSGLVFGYLRSIHPRYAQLPDGASNYLRDFGLAVFVAVTGIAAGPQAITTIKQYGLELFVLGIGVTIIPQIISFYISYYLLKIKNPIILLSTIAGGRSANPAFAALLDKAGNSTPVVPFTATYAIANILLTLWGPLVIGLVTSQ